MNKVVMQLAMDELKLWGPIVSLIALWAVMQWKHKLPSVPTIQHFLEAINSRGGNIIILGVASGYFFRHSMYLFYALLDFSKDGKIQQDNAFALMALQFATSSAFGGAFGAMLKTMTGEGSKARSTDNPSPIEPVNTLEEKK